MKPACLHIRKVAEYEVIGNRDFFVGHKIGGVRGATSDGVYCGWSWEDHTLRVFNCRYGFYPLYYFEKPGEICVSTSIQKLLDQGAPTELDDPGLAVALRMGFFIRDRTPFRAIRTLPPNSELVWTNGVSRIKSRRSLVRPQSLSRSSAIDSFVELVREAMKKRVCRHGDFAMPLSGGRDSRHILLQLADLGYKPTFSVTAKPGVHMSDDPAVAAELSAALSIPHVILEQPRFQYQNFLRKNAMTSYCVPFAHSWTVIIADYLRGKTTTIYDGIGGDVWCQGQWLRLERQELYERDRHEELVNLHLMPRDRDQGLERILSPDFRSRFNRDLAAEQVLKELARHAGSPNPISSFAFWNYTRRSVSQYTFSILTGIPAIHCPYLDHDVHDLLSSLPSSTFLDWTFHSEAIYRAFPKYSHIRFEAKSTDVLRNSIRFFNAGVLRELIGLSQPELFRLVPAISMAFRQTLMGNYRAQLAPYLFQLGREMNGGAGIARDRSTS